MSQWLKRAARLARRDIASQASRTISEFIVAALLVMLTMTVYARVVADRQHNIVSLNSVLTVPPGTE